MPGWLSQILSGHHIDRGWHGLLLLLVIASLLEVGACVGLAYVAGFAQVRMVLADFDWQWLLVLPAAWAVSYLGYYFAYRGIFRVQALFTRRTGPLAGAGILALLLPLTVSYGGAPFATAVAGVFVYRILSTWLPAPACFAVLPTLRKIGGRSHEADGQALVLVSQIPLSAMPASVAAGEPSSPATTRS